MPNYIIDNKYYSLLFFYFSLYFYKCFIYFINFCGFIKYTNEMYYRSKKIRNFFSITPLKKINTKILTFRPPQEYHSFDFHHENHCNDNNSG